MDTKQHDKRPRTEEMPPSARMTAEIRTIILETAHQHGANNVRIFGSAARGDDSQESDLDLLVEFEHGRSLLDRIALAQDLEDVLGIKIDVVTEKALHPLIRAEILAQAQPL